MSKLYRWHGDHVDGVACLSESQVFKAKTMSLVLFSWFAFLMLWRELQNADCASFAHLWTKKYAKQRTSFVLNLIYEEMRKTKILIAMFIKGVSAFFIEYTNNKVYYYWNKSKSLGQRC